MGHIESPPNSKHTMKLIGSLSLLGLAYATSPTTDRQWMAWKQEHGISFKTVAEEARRFKIFGKMREFVKEHNARAAKGLETYTVSLNKFAAMDQNEFLSKYTGETRDLSDKKLVLEYACPNKFVWNGQEIPAAVVLRVRRELRRPSHHRQGPRLLRKLLDFWYRRRCRGCPVRCWPAGLHFLDRCFHAAVG